jgi:N2,N2-dimethylguanosine tRNA methyltransferase
MANYTKYRDVPKMPEEFKSSEKYHHRNGEEYRKWTQEEKEWMVELRDEGYKVREIAESIDRDYTVTSLQMKRIMKKLGRYNTTHLERKYEANREYIKHVNPSTVLDAYCGSYKFYTTEFPNITTTTNDSDKKVEADYNMEALKLLKKLDKEGKTFDVVDLDPYGSAVECFELAIKLATKGLVITLGEMGHKRWKRLDFISKHYDIHTLEDFTLDNLVRDIIKIAEKQGKTLEVYERSNWRNINRVWFIIK